MLGSLKTLVVGLLILASPALAATPAQCKAGCKSDLKPQCEKACREHAKNIADLCIKDMCEVAVKKCETMCEEQQQKKAK